MRRAAVAVLSTTLLLAACSSDDPTVETSPSATETPTASETSEASESGTTETESDLPLPTDSPTTEPAGSETGSEVGAEADMTLTAELTGVEEVPGPGDPAGSGSFSATIVLNEAAGELCYQLEVADLSSEVSAAHIHAGAEGQAGDVYVPLQAPIGGPVDECVAVNATELQPLMEDPEQFYVNVHTQGHPDGAVRGQLQAE